MPSYVTPKKNTQYILFISLVSQASTKLAKVNPTIASGDFKVSIDGGALANLATLPVVTPASSAMVKITLSTSEMNGDNITVVCSDAAGAEWCDLTINVQTSARQIDDLSTYAGGAVASVTGAVGSIGTGGITAASFAAAAIDNAAIATDAIGSAELAASAVAEIQSGLATSAALTTAQADLDDIQTRLPAALVGGRIDASVGAHASGQMPLQPTVAGRTLDVAATGEAGLDFGNIADAGSTHTLTNIIVPVVTTSVNLTQNNDKTGYALTAGEHTAVAADTQTGLTTQGYTTARAGYLDTLNGLVQAIWDKATSALTTAGSIGKRIADNLDALISSRSTYAGGDTSGTTTLLSRLTSGRATNLDNLDAAVSTRLASAGYTAPPTANQNADALLDRADAVEAGLTPRGALRLGATADAGKLSGAATTTVIIRNAVADSKARITATVDADGNRSAVTTDVT